MDEAATGPGSSDVEVLRSACVESQAVLDDQLQELSDIGDKAIWTVRSAVLVLGLVVSAASLGDTETVRTLPPTVTLFVGSGVLSLVVACVYGLGTYFGMDRISGVGAAHRTLAEHGELDERTWRLALLREYDKWIVETEATTDQYGTHLFRAQAVFVFGVVQFVAGGSLSVLTL